MKSDFNFIELISCTDFLREFQSDEHGTLKQKVITKKNIAKLIEHKPCLILELGVLHFHITKTNIKQRQRIYVSYFVRKQTTLRK